MKRIIMILSAMAAIVSFAASCEKEFKEPGAPEEKSGNTVCFTATCEGAVVKTTIENGDGNSRIVKWTNGDKIDLLWAGGSYQPEAAVTGDGTTADFEAVIDTPASAYYAVYPTGVGSLATDPSEVLSITVPASQDGTFANSNIAVAKTDAISHNLTFYNATALVKFSVSDASYTKAVFAGTNGEAVAGEATIDFGDGTSAPTMTTASTAAKSVEVNISGAGEYYFAVLPGTFSNGFSITLFKGSVADRPRSVQTSRNLGRATILNMGAVDGVATVTNYFVKPDGNGSGKSWEKAMGPAELKALLETSSDSNVSDAKARLLDGVTIHMAAGEYYLAGEANGQVKIEFNGYDHQVAVTFKGGYPDNLTGTTTSGWAMPTAEETDPTYCTAFTGNGEAGIFVFGNQTDITFQGITFKDCYFDGSKDNGALNCAAGTSGDCSINLEYCRILDNKNTTAKSGAGIILYKCAATISHCYFKGNYARNAGALHMPNGNAGTKTISYCTFESNNASNTSGAVQNGGQTDVSFDHCTFTGNSCPTYGGAFHTGNSAVTTFEDCSFTSNSCTGTGTGNKGKGGAVSLESSSSATFTRCTFTGNKADIGSQSRAGNGETATTSGKEGTALEDNVAGGAIIHRGSGTLALNACTFENNTAPNGCGGAMAITNNSAIVNINAGTSFSGNTAYFHGGAIMARGGFTITGTSESKVTFTGNKTLCTGNQHANGGAIWILNGTTSSMSYAVFTNNEAGQESGSTVNYSNGGVAKMLAVTSFSASNCEFTGNRGRNGMCFSFELGDKKATFTDCNFHDNVGRSGASKNGNSGNFHGGAAQLGSGTVEFTRCDFTDNVAYNGSGAVHQNGASTTSKFTDCTFTRNSCLDGEAGCVQVESTGQAQVDGCTFTNNSIASGSTVRNGGVFYLKVAGSNLKATGCTFTGNKITGSGNAYGAVVRAQDNSDIQFDDCVFDGNGNVGGGTIYSGGCIALNKNAHLKVNNCLFKNNVAKSRGAAIQGGTDVIVYMNNVSFYNNTTTDSGNSWGVNTHFGNSNVCMNNVTSYNNRNTNGSQASVVSFNGDGGWMVVNSTIIDGTPTAVVRRGNNSRKAVFCNNVLINTNTANNVWAMNSTTNFSSKGHNVISADGTYNNAAPAASDLLSQTSLSSGAYSEHWNATPHYAVYTWTNSLVGFTPAVQSDVTDAIDAYTETDSVHTGITSIGADFKSWLESLDPVGYTVDGRSIARTGTWWPGAYQNN